MPTKLVRLFLTAVLLAACAFKSRAVSSISYEIDGIFETQLFENELPNLKTRIVRPFKLIFSNGNWRVHSVQASNEYCEVACDQTNTYSIFFSQLAQTDAHSGKTRRGNFASGAVDSGCYPSSYGAEVKLPWLTYASADYLRQLRDSVMPVPWCLPRVEPEAYAYHAQIQALPTSPQLPERIGFTAEKSLIEKADKADGLETELTNEKVLAERKLFLKLLYDGFVGGAYIVESTTNIQGILLPTRARLERYRLTDRDETKKMLFEVSTVTATKMSVPATSSPILSLTQDVSVVDFRVKDSKSRIDYVKYKQTNNIWPRVDELTSLLQAKKQMRPAYEFPKKEWHPWVVLFLFLVFVSPLIILVYIKQKPIKVK